MTVAADPAFGRREDHLTLTVPVTYPEAPLGATVSVPTPDGPVSLKVPAGTTSGRTFRGKGKGFPRKGGTGDLMVTVEVAVPANMSPAAREALEAYAAIAPDDPRKDLRGVTL